MLHDALILHAGALGDLVLTLQLALRLPGFAEARAVRIISRVNPGDLIACRPSLVRDSSEHYGLHWLHIDGSAPPPPRLRDVVHGGRVLSALAGPDSVVHQRLAALRPTALYSFDARPDAASVRHITGQWQSRLEAQGLLVPKCVHQRPRARGLGVPDALRARGRALAHALLSERGAPASAAGAPYLVLHPGSGGRRKCWPLASFIHVARGLLDAPPGGRPVRPLFLLGAAEVETWPANVVATLSDEFAVLSCPPPDDLAALLAGAAAYVGNDAGPTHLAALLGTPTIAIFGPTDARIWRPLGPAAHVIAGDPPAGPDWGIDTKSVTAAAWAAAGQYRGPLTEPRPCPSQSRL